MLKLKFNFQFEDLYKLESLSKLDDIFQKELTEQSRKTLLNARKSSLNEIEEANSIFEIAHEFEKFIADFFGIKEELMQMQQLQQDMQIIHEIKRNFIQKKVLRKYDANSVINLNYEDLKKRVLKISGLKFLTQQNLAKQIKNSLQEKKDDEIDLLMKFCAISYYGNHMPNSSLFNIPKKLNYDFLLKNNVIEEKGVFKSTKEKDFRDHFNLTDQGENAEFAIDQANYCIFCHKQGKDSCSKGLTTEKHGCPLEEKISEMNYLKSHGKPLAALATAMIDNPLLAATGHRICNDCMKSCIYQKQDPVDVPQIETRVLKDILSLPYGFEIYSLLSRWNPLNFKSFLPKKPTGKKIMVAGMGPAGFTLAHYLLNSGHDIIGIDGLKIEPLPEEISGVDQFGNIKKFKPIKHIQQLQSDLENRQGTGFGGVAEYGITVRWDKNFLNIIRVLLERRHNFRLIDSVRIGSNPTYDQAFEMGFDHIALCIGAGKPTIIDIPNNFTKYVRTASDFLMNLQLSKPFKKNSIANLQIRLPILVIGGGLTAIDAATESLAYYPRKVAKFKHFYDQIDQDEFWNNLSLEETEIAQEFLQHAKELEKLSNKEKQSFIEKLGGVKIIYRKKLVEAPCYRLNHEEVSLAFEEGIKFQEQTTPLEFIQDQFGNIAAVKCQTTQGIEEIPAKSVLIAAGTSPNITPNEEFSGSFEVDGKFFAAYDEKLQKISPEKFCKTKNLAMLTKFKGEAKISFFGDMHPSFAGNVVKAMASAKNGYEIINKIVAKKAAMSNVESEKFFNLTTKNLISKIEQINVLAPNIVELIVKSPIAARNFQPGQFYRFQNYDISAPTLNDLKLASEPLALTGASKNHHNGTISLIILEMGGSSNVCAKLTKGEKVSLMGPTGEPTQIATNSNIVLIGGGLGNAVLFSIGQKLKEKDCHVTYFAGYRSLSQVFKMSEIEKAADSVVWCADDGEIQANRPCDISFHGNMLQALEKYKNNKLTGLKNFIETDEIIVIGSDSLMAAVNEFRKKYFSNEIKATASINSPMQCMMKEICGQCIQEHIDPKSGKKSYVYSCKTQDQCMKKVNFKFLKERLSVNSISEKLIKSSLNNI